MKAIEIKNPGGADVLYLTERPKPVPKDDDVLIRVIAAGINRPDILQREGKYPPPEGASDIPGLEVSGVIEDTGEEVCALLEGGGYAEYAIARRTQCLPKPDNLSFEEAAALPECVFTVWNNVFVLGGFQTGETALVHGGTSGIGTTAIQMIKAMGGRVIVTCGSDEKCRAAGKLGADLVVNYNADDFVDSVQDFTDGAGVDMVLDMVGGDYVRRNLDCLKEYGRHVSIAFLRGAKAEIIVPTLMRKRITMTGSVLRARPAEEKADLAAGIKEHIWPLIKAGTIKPVIHEVFDLKDAKNAHETMETGDHIGKLVLRV